jgi:hypothetical protein
VGMLADRKSGTCVMQNTCWSMTADVLFCEKRSISASLIPEFCRGLLGIDWGKQGNICGTLTDVHHVPQMLLAIIIAEGKATIKPHVVATSLASLAPYLCFSVFDGFRDRRMHA